jgi:heme-degrading monooxygenase HmoA
MATSSNRQVPPSSVEADMNHPYASGNWVVSPGREKEFIERWTEFLVWTRASSAGLRSAHLIRDQEDPRHFISFADWENAEAMQAWRSLPDFARNLSACRALCDDFRGSTYTVAATV